MSSEYIPQDLSIVNKISDIKNQEEFEQDIVEICETLKDLSTL